MNAALRYLALVLSLTLVPIAASSDELGSGDEFDSYSDELPSVEQIEAIRQIVTTVPFFRDFTNVLIAPIGYRIPASALPGQHTHSDKRNTRAAADEDDGMLIPLPISIDDVLKELDELEQKYPGISIPEIDFLDPVKKAKLKEHLRETLRGLGIEEALLDEAVEQFLGNGGIWIPFLDLIDPELAIKLEIFNNIIKATHLVAKLLTQIMAELDAEGTPKTLRAIVIHLVESIEGCSSNHPGDGIITEEELACFLGKNEIARLLEKRLRRIVDLIEKLKLRGDSKIDVR